MAQPVRGIALSAWLVLLVALAPLVGAQIRLPLEGAPRGTAAAASASPSAIALEGAVDPDVYIVGPGDVFSISVGGRAALQALAPVSADGLLVVTGIGTFRAADRRLSAVRSEVLAAMRRQFANVAVGASLAVPRQFYVHVSGAVPLPGRQLVTAGSRVEDALLAATAQPDAPFDLRRPLSVRQLGQYDVPSTRRVERRPALRNVRVVSRDGAERTVDLARYFATGDTAFNPVLDDGDSVLLPVFDPDREGVYVEGAVDRPGTYDWRPGDTALDLLTVAAGNEVSGRVGGVRRTRRGAGGVETVEVALDEAQSLEILPQDALYVVAANQNAGQASVLGEGVPFPGTYPITVGQTTLQDLVEMAGGLAPEALLRAATLQRRARSEAEETVDDRALGFTDRVTSRSLDTTATDIATLSTLPIYARRYYAQESQRTPQVSVDLASALAGETRVVLQDGDQLMVPRDLGTVRVFGQVARGGYLAYQEGQRASAYVQAAGGPGPVATQIYVVDAATGQLAAGPDGIVLPGDAVFVDRRPTADNPQYEGLAVQQLQIERQEARDRRQTRFQLIQTTLAAIGTVLTAIAVINSLNRE